MNRFRPDIEGLRAIAILLVVAYHAGVPGFAGGYIGVDVFFVLSGYLITSLLVRELEQTGSIDFVNFYARRTRRLLPAVAVVILVTMAVSSVLYAPVEQDGLANTSIATSAYASNLYFAHASTDYLAARTHTNPLLHTWSLSVEEQFYLVWPLLMLALSGVWFGRRRIRYGVIFGGMLVVGGASLIGAIYLTRTTQPWAFFLSPPRAWEFAIGAIAMLPRVSGLNSRVTTALGWAGLIGVLAAGVAYGSRTVFPGTAALLPTISTALILCAGARSTNQGVARLLGLAFFREIGRLSYSWYLWHWPFLVFAASLDDSLTLVDRLIVVLLALGAAQISYRWVEEPVRHNRTLTVRPRWALAVAAGIAVAGVSLGLVWKSRSANWAERPSQAQFTRMKNDFPEIYRMDCDDYFHSATVKECAFGPADAPRTAVLFGDSHAGHWFPALRSIFDAHRDWRLIVITKSSCPVVDALYFSPDLGRPFTECHEWLKGSLKRLHEMHPDLVLVSYSSGYPLSRNDWQSGIASAVQSLSASSASVILLRDIPGLGFDGPNCLARLDWRPPFLRQWATCRTDLAGDGSDQAYLLQREAALPFKNVTTLDMNNAVCPSGICRVVQDGIVSYRDAAHLSTAFSRSLSGKLAEGIASGLKKLPNSPSFTVGFSG